MPPRLSRRQQRQQDELHDLYGISPVQETRNDHEGAESSEDEVLVATSKVPGFAALAQPAVNDEDEGDEEDRDQQKTAKKKNKKKKKKETEKLAAVDPSSHKSQKLAEKNKTKGKKSEAGDDLDKALAELSVKYPDLQHVVHATKGGTSGPRSFAGRQNTLLAVSLPHLDSEAELRRFFGSKVVSASKAQEKRPRGSAAVPKNLKSNLTKPQATWWSASQREGLSIRPLTEDELRGKATRGKIAIGGKGERWWTVQYSKRYRNITKAFIGAVMSGDPERLYRILSKLPWHADTLLQISEVYRHREEHSSSVDFLNRALFTYERSFIGAFSFTAGTNRLDFDHVENRPFYLALSRMVADLQRRGCSRTAFEFARLLLSLDPHTDPHGALLFLDFLAVKSGMHDWLLSLWDLHDEEAKSNWDIHDVWSSFNVTIFPGWSYARALALRADEDAKKQDHKASTSALKEAIFAFPTVVPLLADRVDIILSGDLRGHPDFRVHIDASSLGGHEPLIHLLSHLYAYRSSSLWKMPEKSAWLKETAISAFGEYDAKKRKNALRERFAKQFRTERSSTDSGIAALDLHRSDLARSIYRHIGALADANTTRRLTAFFPREIINASSLSCDPLPPHTAVSWYNDDFFVDCEDVFAFRPRTRREQEVDARMLARMIPDANVRHQLQAVYDGRPDIQRQFPEGVAQFAQIAAQLGEEFWDNLLPQIVGGIGEGNGGMPGGFVDADLDDEGDGDVDQPGNEREVAAQDEGRGGAGDVEDLDDDEESSDGEENEPALPIRVLRNLVNRFWGGGAAAPAQDNAHADA